MGKFMKVFSISFIFIFLLTTNSFAGSDIVIDSEITEFNHQIVQRNQNVMPMKLETDILFNQLDRWSKGTTVGMWSGESHVNVWIENRGSSSFTFTVASTPYFTNPIAVETIRPGQNKTIRVEYQDLIAYYAGGLVCDVYVQAYSYNNNVVGRLRVAGR